MIPSSRIQVPTLSPAHHIRDQLLHCQRVPGVPSMQDLKENIKQHMREYIITDPKGLGNVLTGVRQSICPGMCIHHAFGQGYVWIGGVRVWIGICYTGSFWLVGSLLYGMVLQRN